MKKIYIIGDSHAHQLSIAYRMSKMRDFADAGFDVEFRLFGAVKQAMLPHHQVEGNSIALLEEHWEQRAMPFAEGDLHNPDVAYLLSLPFNVSILLRHAQMNLYTSDPRNSRRQFLSSALISELVTRRNFLGVGLARDMAAIGLRTMAIASPRPFANSPFVGNNTPMLEALIRRFYVQTALELDDAGVAVISQPDDTLTDDGLFTCKQHNSGDQQHATRDYYTDMLRHILSQIQAMNP